jgi:hypothetical protein
MTCFYGGVVVLRVVRCGRARAWGVLLRRGVVVAWSRAEEEEVGQRGLALSTLLRTPTPTVPLSSWSPQRAHLVEALAALGVNHGVAGGREEEEEVGLLNLVVLLLSSKRRLSLFLV